MGGPKIFAHGPEGAFCQYIERTARAVGFPILWVLSHHDQAARVESLIGTSVHYAVNSTVGGDMFSSVVAGSMGLPSGSAAPAIVWPVDFPFVSPPTLAAIAGGALYADIVKPLYEGRAGHPLLLSRRALALAVSTVRQQGLRSFFAETTLSLGFVAVNDPQIHNNINHRQ
ncbi:NTP transferase domain-containing protein [Myxococcota bacterium]|nr:NTP transferase domain-containing protein [Myxococcota bacterium]